VRSIDTGLPDSLSEHYASDKELVAGTHSKLVADYLLYRFAELYLGEHYTEDCSISFFGNSIPLAGASIDVENISNEEVSEIASKLIDESAS
jgi:hypothetical protein